jgi:peptide-methionine (S)-S-oxide reductase
MKLFVRQALQWDRPQSGRLQSGESIRKALGIVLLKGELQMSSSKSLAVIFLSSLLGATACSARANSAAPLPAPAVDAPKAATPGKQTAVFSGGCFWGVQAVFQHVKGVIKATSGYAGGSGKTADYETVSTGQTGHAESVQVVFDPSQVTYGELLRVFFSVAHDPTELNHQGPDTGTQYRSMISFTSDEQKHIAQAYIAQLDEAKVFSHSIVTQVVPLQGFYPAEAYHQNYAENHPNEPYIMFNDLPKVDHLKKEFPDLYSGKPAGS